MKSDNQIIRKTLNLFFIFFISIGGIISGLASAFYQTEINSMFKETQNQEILTVTMQNKVVSEKISAIIGNLFFLSRQNELTAFLDSQNPKHLQSIEKEYIEISRHSKIYDQLRYCDNSGHEKVRVNYNGGDVAAVPIEKLQDKSNRYYFTDAIKLARDNVFVSPLDLNIEKGEIEKPFKPMIRLATPVYDSNNNKSGIVLINYLAETLLQNVSGAGKLSVGNLMLLNPEGYWLRNQGNKDTEWGFMFEERKQQNFSTYYSEEWSIINNNKTGQLKTDNGLFTYQYVYPLDKTIVPHSSDYFWVLISHIPQSIIKQNKRELLFTLFLFGAATFVFVALGSWFAALTIIRRKLHKLELEEMATRDSLTSLPNRRVCFERLKSGVDHAYRFKRKLGILYIDLDGFKVVNDTKGHSAGDELLIKVSEILTSISRSSDVVTRLGGDEFVCILTEIDSIEGAIHAGNKVIEALNVPFDLSDGRIFIGASVGVAVYPDHDTDPEILLTKADRAMYESKAKGKNNCTLFKQTT